MESVLRGAAVYGMLLVIFRITGKRTLGQITTFDFILLLIISEAIQNGMVGTSYSVTNALVLILTLVVVQRVQIPVPGAGLEGAPLIIVENGRALHDRMRSAGVDTSDVLHAARYLHGLERLEQIKYAVLERNGEISIIPQRSAASARDQAA